MYIKTSTIQSLAGSQLYLVTWCRGANIDIEGITRRIEIRGEKVLTEGVLHSVRQVHCDVEKNISWWNEWIGRRVLCVEEVSVLDTWSLI